MRFTTTESTLKFSRPEHSRRIVPPWRRCHRIRSQFLSATTETLRGRFLSQRASCLYFQRPRTGPCMVGLIPSLDVALSAEAFWTSKRAVRRLETWSCASYTERGRALFLRLAALCHRTC